MNYFYLLIEVLSLGISSSQTSFTDGHSGGRCRHVPSWNLYNQQTFLSLTKPPGPGHRKNVDMVITSYHKSYTSSATTTPVTEAYNNIQEKDMAAPEAEASDTTAHKVNMSTKTDTARHNQTNNPSRGRENTHVPHLHRVWMTGSLRT